MDEPAKHKYHHGDLRSALIAASEEILNERGVSGFSLREAARRAGVSPGAPAHHFGDARGLLTAIATLGYEGLDAALKAADESVPFDDRKARYVAQGLAYIGFAQAFPARFALMWRYEVLDCSNQDFMIAGASAYGRIYCLVTGIDFEGFMRNITPAGGPPDARVIGAWSLVHGYANLAGNQALGAEDTALRTEVLTRFAAILD